MAVVLSSATAVKRSNESIFSRFVKWLSEVSEAQARPVRREIAQLHAMSDRELADIGISRGEIEYVVIHGRSYL